MNGKDDMDNGTQEQLKQISDIMAPQRQLRRSVKREDSGDNSTIRIIMPDIQPASALPKTLPQSRRFNGGTYFNQHRDYILLSTPEHEGMWAVAVGKAIAEKLSMGFDIESNIALRRKKVQEWLLNAGAGMGIFGWVPFLSMHLRSYYLTGVAFIEIERATSANGSKVINIHHLNPLRCRLTNNSQYPVEYMSDSGGVHKLGWWQVIVIVDQPDTTEGEFGSYQSAAVRAYPQIVKLAAIENFIYERVSGSRPLKLTFLGGATKRAITDALQSVKHDAARQGINSYLGAAVIPVSGDVPLNLVEVNLADLPDITDVERERNRSDLIYANALYIDPQLINPTLIGRQGLGSTGNQAEILAEKDGGQRSWEQQFQHQLNQLALDDKVTFTFTERDLTDEKQQADNAMKRQETRANMIETGMITAEQAVNLAVDAEDLPREFVEVDETGGDKLRDDEKPEEQQEEPDTDNESEPEEETEAEQLMAKTKAAAVDLWNEVYH